MKYAKWKAKIPPPTIKTSLIKIINLRIELLPGIIYRLFNIENKSLLKLEGKMGRILVKVWELGWLGVKMDY